MLRKKILLLFAQFHHSKCQFMSFEEGRVNLLLLYCHHSFISCFWCFEISKLCSFLKVLRNMMFVHFVVVFFTLKVFVYMRTISNDSFLFFLLMLNSSLVVFMLFRFISSVYLCFLCFRFLVSIFSIFFSLLHSHPSIDSYIEIFSALLALSSVFTISPRFIAIGHLE